MIVCTALRVGFIPLASVINLLLRFHISLFIDVQGTSVTALCYFVAGRGYLNCRESWLKPHGVSV